MKLILFAFASTLLLYACAETKQSKAKTVNQFSWLNGNWSMPTDNGTVTEEWKLINDSLMEGKSDFVKGDSITPFETIRLFRRDTSFYYEAKAAGQNKEQPVEFKLNTFSDSGFTAENLQHDFPKRITYRLVNKDSIHAFIDGGPQQPEKKSDFYYSRSKN
ncbi:MAG: hypothetical protein HEQ40_12920 [Lacibacter sp.]|jgi:hypothetical protein